MGILDLTQQRPLLISGLIEHAGTNHGSVKVVPPKSDSSVCRATGAKFAAGVKQLANALTTPVVKPHIPSKKNCGKDV